MQDVPSPKMNKFVLDASALLALMNKEPGHEVVANAVAYSLMSSVNVSEAAIILHKHGIDIKDARILINDMLAEIVPFNDEHAFTAASLNKQTSRFGLSLGDRACLSVAYHLKLPVLTADRQWAKVHIGVPVELIR